LFLTSGLGIYYKLPTVDLPIQRTQALVHTLPQTQTSKIFPHKFKSRLRQSDSPCRPKTPHSSLLPSYHYYPPIPTCSYFPPLPKKPHSFILTYIVPSGLSACIDTLRWVETHRCNIIVLSGLSQHRYQNNHKTRL